MHIHWFSGIVGLVLLICPLDVFLRGNVSVRSYEKICERRGRAARRWWLQPGLLVDVPRAFAGGWLLRNAWTIEPPLEGIGRHLPLAVSVAFMGLALLVQMHTSRKAGVVLAPVGFSAGLVFALLPLWVAALVVVLAVVSLIGFRGWSAYFLSGALGAGALGFMALRFDAWMIAAVLLMMEPLLVSLLADRELVLPFSRGRRSTEGPSGLLGPSRDPQILAWR